MNYKMWVNALQTIPRLSKKEWNALDIISKWLISTRAAVLVMTFLSAAIGGLLAWKAGCFNIWQWLLCAFGLVFAHATNNLLNDLVDHLKGVDKDNYFRTQYGPQTLESGFFSLKEMLLYIFVTGFIAFACGVALILIHGTGVLILFLLGSFFLLFYTFPLKYIGMGEIAVIIVWGPLMVGGTYFVLSGNWDWNVTIASLPYALGVTTVIFGKHIDKLLEDKKKKIHTLPVIIGEKASRYSVIGMMILMYVITVYLVVTGYFALIILIIFLSAALLPPIFKAYLTQRPKEAPKNYPKDVWPLYFVAFAFQHMRRFGMLFMLGLLLQACF